MRSRALRGWGVQGGKAPLALLPPTWCKRLMSAALRCLDRDLPLLLGLMLLSLVFHGLPAGPAGGAIIFGGGQDPAVFVWCLNWWSFALAHGLAVWRTGFVDAPVGASLAWTTAVPGFGLLLGPLIRLCGAVGVYNALMGLASPLAGFATYLAGCELTGRTAPAVAAGLLFAVMPYQAGQNIGHLDLCFTAAIPLCLTVGLRAHRRAWPAWRLAVWLGVLLAFLFGVAQELLASLVLCGAAGLAALAWRLPAARPGLRRLVPGLAGGLGLAVVSISPILWQMARAYGATAGQLPEPADFSADLLGFVVPSQLVWLGGQAARGVSDRFTGNYTEQSAYLGLPLILLLAFIARTPGPGRMAVVAAGIAGILALGPFLHIGGAIVSTAPWLALYHVPLLHELLPARFALYMDLAAALACACWVARPGAWRWAMLAVCALPLLPSRAADRAWVSLTLPPAIASLPAGADLTILPLFGQEMGLQYLDGMRFTLVGQGYLGTGLPRPFAAAPVYAPLWSNDFAAIDPAAFARFLTTYGTQYVAVLPTGYGFARPGADDAAESAAAVVLLQKAGWRAASVTPQAVIYAPSGPPPVAAPAPAPVAPPPDSPLHQRMTILTLLALVSALAAWAEARFRARRADAPVWLIAIFLAWIFALPAYLIIRRAWRWRA